MPRRSSSMLINPAPQPDLPSPSEARTAAATVGLNLDDIQGDILVGMKKKRELFFFFGISDVAAFKSKLGTDIHDRITSTTKLIDTAQQPVTAVNIAFSHSGLTTLGVADADQLNDDNFNKGQLADAAFLGDPGTGNWVQGFAGTSIHGVLLLASDTQDNIDNELKGIQSALGSSITEIHRLQGAARPGDQEGHEHFGYMDGISQPAVEGFDKNPKPGQFVAKPGAILLGEDGDGPSRPTWAKSGSFLAFRQLKQRVPEFNKFVTDNALSVPGLTQQENIDLTGARMVGRWKSGAPIDLAPLRDDPALAKDDQRNNNFNFAHPELGSAFDLTTNQTLCPFSAHIAKSRPRAILGDPEISFAHIMRAGIPYGPEVTADEASAQKTSDDPSLERGLAFVAYQSTLSSGFTFIQHSWVDSVGFPRGNVGVDPIIGSTNSGPPGDAQRTITGLDPTNFQKPIVINEDFVVSRGGEYFFSPPISALITPLSK
ncbi:dye-decolorizing heme-containing peroxidase [Marasmius crinis-equi]|uniref:Dye-decolorizing heme-containing peroxidase n=1 Tax=Marasmius crinis-equi TaxID=585013 RepID=A0ABR3ERL1_9AGAR